MEHHISNEDGDYENTCNLSTGMSTTSTSPAGFSPSSFRESPILHSTIKAEPSSTTVPFFKYHQMHQSSTEAEFSFPTSNTSSHISDDGFELQVQAGVGSASGLISTTPSNSTGLKQCQREKVRQEYSQYLSRSVVPVTLSKSEMSATNKSGQSVHVSMHASLVNAASASEPEEIMIKDQQSGCNQVPHSDPRNSISSSTTERSSVDGYNWRKYGQKLVKGSEFPRSYYKCTYPNCEVKKIFESSPDGHIAYIVYKGSHDHPIPQPRRRFIPGTRTSIQEEKFDKDSYFNGQEDKVNRNVSTSSSHPGFSPTSFLESPLLHSNIKAEPSPTTDSFFKYHQMHQSSTEAEFSFPTSNTSSHISDDGFKFQVQAGAGSASGFTSTPPSDCTGLKQFQREKVRQEYNQCLSRSVVPVTLSKSEMSAPNKSGQSVHVSMHASLVNAASASEPEEITKKDQQSGCNQVSHSDPRSAISSSTSEISLVDGYNWRKYGEKLVKGSEFPRSYYKCTYPNCEVKKIFESSPDGHIAYIVYKGSHDHPIPQPRRHFIPGTRMSIQEEKNHKDSYFNGQEDKFNRNVSTSSSHPGFSPTSFLESPLLHSNIKEEPSPTTDSVFKYHQMHQSSTETEFSFPTSNTSSHISDDGFEFQVQAGARSASRFTSTPPSNCTGLKQFQREKVRQEYNQCLSRSVVPVTLSKSEMSAPNKSGKSVHVSKHASLVNAASASEPEEITKKDQQSGCNEVSHSDPRSAISSSTAEISLVDGYNKSGKSVHVSKHASLVNAASASEPEEITKKDQQSGCNEVSHSDPRSAISSSTAEISLVDGYNKSGKSVHVSKHASLVNAASASEPEEITKKDQQSGCNEVSHSDPRSAISSSTAEISLVDGYNKSGKSVHVSKHASLVNAASASEPEEITKKDQQSGCNEVSHSDPRSAISSSTAEISLVDGYNKSGKSVHVSKHASLVNAASASEPEEITKKDQQSGCNEVSHSDPRSAISSSTAEISLVDGYNWRKYGEKLVKRSEFPRSYYKCTYPNCEVKKIFESSPDGHIAYIVYKGSHDHPIPQPRRRFIPGTRTSIQEEKFDKDSYFNGQEDKFNRNGLPSRSDPNVMNVISPRQVVEDSPEGASDEIDKEDPFSRKRKIDGSVYITPVIKPICEPRVVVQTLSEVEILDDGYRWRKYGQKVVRGNPNPRSYYKCTYAKCSVRKHVERASHDPKAVITTYEGKHSHDLPTARSSNHELSWSPPVNGTH